MSEQSTPVTVPYGENAGETATLLLAAAEEVCGDQSVVRTVEGAFVAPKEVADKAGVDYEDPDADQQDRSVSEQDEADDKPAAKKSAPPKK